MTISIVVAVDLSNGFSQNDKIPWHIKNDLVNFYNITKNGAVIMGRKTWESIGKPLKNRENYVVTSSVTTTVTSSPTNFENVTIVSTISEALEKTMNDNIFIIGGENIYNEILQKKLWDYIYITKVYLKFGCDRFFNLPECRQEISSSEIMYDKKSDLYYSFHKYSSKNGEEEQYLDLLQKVINSQGRITRNGITRSLFSPKSLEFDLSTGNLPALTTKRIWIRGAFYELLWFLSGSTDSNELSNKGVHIWSGNSSREFLDSRGLHHFPVGEIGETYGFLFRHYGGDFATKTGGVDQVMELIQNINNNPTDRRLIINLWNPNSMTNCALPPCMYFYQFYCYQANERSESVSEANGADNKRTYNERSELEGRASTTSESVSEANGASQGSLDLAVNIRSSDFFVGNPWNIITASLMLLFIAKLTKRRPGRLIMNLGDVHIYEQHVKLAKLQLERKSRAFPKIEIIKELNSLQDILNLDFDKDIVIKNYKPDPTIKAEMIA